MLSPGGARVGHTEHSPSWAPSHLVSLDPPSVHPVQFLGQAASLRALVLMSLGA